MTNFINLYFYAPRLNFEQKNVVTAKKDDCNGLIFVLYGVSMFIQTLLKQTNAEFPDNEGKPEIK